MLPRLAAYAGECMRRAGWREGRDSAPSATSVADVLQEMAMCCLLETRAWPQGVSLEAFLRGVVRSLVSHRLIAVLRRREVAYEGCEERPAPSSRRDAAIDQRRLVGAMKRALEGGEPDVEALFAAYVDGVYARGDLADMLGWTPEHVSGVRVKLSQRLKQVAGLMDEDDDERAQHGRPQGAASTPRRSAR